MIKTSLPRDFIYGFQGDMNLVKQYSQDCLLNGIEFHKTYTDSSASEFGYPVLKNDKLFDWITECLNKVGDQYFKFTADYKLIICDAWLTRTNYLNTSRSHNHSLSIFSGLLYLHDSDTETIFTVENEFTKRNQHFLADILKLDISNNIRIKPEIGKLIIWPSYVFHNIAVNKSKELRYTLAFNSFLDGELGKQPTRKLNIKTSRFDS